MFTLHRISNTNSSYIASHTLNDHSLWNKHLIHLKIYWMWINRPIQYSPSCQPFRFNVCICFEIALKWNNLTTNLTPECQILNLTENPRNVGYLRYFWPNTSQMELNFRFWQLSHKLNITKTKPWISKKKGKMIFLREVCRVMFISDLILIGKNLGIYFKLCKSRKKKLIKSNLLAAQVL